MYIAVLVMALLIFNFRKTIFKHILLKPDLKEEFFCSIEYLTQEFDLNLQNEYTPDYIYKIMNPLKSVPLTFKNFASNLANQ